MTVHASQLVYSTFMFGAMGDSTGSSDSGVYAALRNAYSVNMGRLVVNLLPYILSLKAL